MFLSSLGRGCGGGCRRALGSGAYMLVRPFADGWYGFSLGPIELVCSFTRQITVIRKIHDGTDQGMDYSWVTGVVIASNSR